MNTTIQSIQIGMPQHFGTPGATEPDRRAWFSGFKKLPVDGSVEVTATGLVGDGQADLLNHGGLDKAILCYSAEHFQAWRCELNRTEVTGGMFGENFTLEHGTERDVCIGDSYSIGDVVVQVTQPRQPCWKLGRHWENSQLPKMVVQTGFCGWYLRVLSTGMVEPGMKFELIQRLQPEWSVRRAHRVKYAKREDAEFADKQELAQLPELSEAWKSELIE